MAPRRHWVRYWMTFSARAQHPLQCPELLSALDLALLELEKSLFRYARVRPELLEMADEGLLLAARTKARLGQALSAAQHTESHLQVVGDWKPTGTSPAWNAEARLRRRSPNLLSAAIVLEGLLSGDVP